MILLIVAFYIPAKALSMIPTKAQNLSELIISGIEEFMVTVTGEEGLVRSKRTTNYSSRLRKPPRAKS
jgi:F0F1-type ATP synthase membrane subunit a